MEDTGPENHPIQLRAINIGELHIRLNGAPDRSYSPSGEQFQLTPSWTEYDSEDKTVGVRVKIDIGDLETDSGESTAPFDLTVEVTGIFEVDDTRFDTKHVAHWAKHNAPMILYPYARENVYSLTTRSGFTGVILPLLVVPTPKQSGSSVSTSD